jgi:hypothetical protein
MSGPDPAAAPSVRRRSFLGRAGGTLALGIAGLLARSSAAAAGPTDGPDWPGALPGRHRQLVDGYSINGGAPLSFAYTFLEPNSSACAVIVLRHNALPIALESLIWEKYGIGEAFVIIDPETKAPARKNPFLRPRPGVLWSPEIAIDRLLARGAVVGACNVALQGQSAELAARAGVTPADAAREWAANLVAGVTVIPSGTWGVNRAQEAGCTYCSGG